MRERQGHFRVTSRRLENALSGQQMVIVEMLRGAAAIISCAIRAGYLDERLQRTCKPLVRNASGSVGGFQSGLVRSGRDIEDEVKFFRSETVTDLLSTAGISDREFVRMVGHVKSPPLSNSSLAN